MSEIFLNGVNFLCCCFFKTQTEKNWQKSSIFRSFFFFPEENHFISRALSYKQDLPEFFFKCMLRWNRSSVSQPVHQRWESKLQKSLVSPRGDIYFGIIFMQLGSFKAAICYWRCSNPFQWLCLHVVVGEAKQFGLQNLKKYWLHGAYKHFGNNMWNSSNSAHINKLPLKYISVINTSLHLTT